MQQFCFFVDPSSVGAQPSAGRRGPLGAARHQGRFLHIRYFAMRDPLDTDRGCLEVTQDVTRIRGLQGQRRLLEWS